MAKKLMFECDYCETFIDGGNVPLTITFAGEYHFCDENCLRTHLEENIPRAFADPNEIPF